MFHKGDKVVTKDHKRFWDITETNAQLDQLQERPVSGGHEGIVTKILDNGDETVSIEVRHSQDDYREYAPEELEKKT